MHEPKQAQLAPLPQVRIRLYLNEIAPKKKKVENKTFEKKNAKNVRLTINMKKGQGKQIHLAVVVPTSICYILGSEYY